MASRRKTRQSIANNENISDSDLDLRAITYQGQGRTPAVNPSNEGPKPRVSMKTVSQGMMDVSLLTSNAAQLRTALLHPKYDFYWPLVCLIIVSMTLQVVTRVVMLRADYLKHQDPYQRKQLQFLGLVFLSFITVTNALISAFNVSPHE
ncbi:ninjurin-1-like [Saccostrea cucullata]|uniref:ninjurin-1-like n=1 Tax=Saccostrea cuccullata TaxID=36930 RepID=UPI002ED5BC23